MEKKSLWGLIVALVAALVAITVAFIRDKKKRVIEDLQKEANRVQVQAVARFTQEVQAAINAVETAMKKSDDDLDTLEIKSLLTELREVKLLAPLYANYADNPFEKGRRIQRLNIWTARIAAQRKTDALKDMRRTMIDITSSMR